MLASASSQLSHNTAFAAMRRQGMTDYGAVYESIALEDVRNTADVFRGVYDSSGGRDGFVSLGITATCTALWARSINPPVPG